MFGLRSLILLPLLSGLCSSAIHVAPTSTGPVVRAANGATAVPTTGPNVVFPQSDGEEGGGAAEEAPVEAGVPRTGPWLVLAPVDRRGRRPLRTDVVLATYGMGPRVKGPKEGDELTGELGEPQVWTAVAPDAEGWIAAAEGSEVGVAHTTIESDRRRVVLARLRGAGLLQVGTRSYAGDVYDYGFGGFPVVLEEGTNHVFVSGVRGRFSLTLAEPEAPVSIGAWDVTIPDLLTDALAVLPIQAPFVNATLEGIDVEVHVGTREDGPVVRQRAGIYRMPAATTTMVAFTIAPEGHRPELFAELETLDVPVTLSDLDGEELARHVVRVRCKRSTEAHVDARFSRVDGSVQVYGIVPSRETEPEARGALVTLHGAGVDVASQIACYPQLDDVVILAPSNRRPYGFDWQDWGRLDLNETLFRQYGPQRIDRDRVWLTGHSMGGHGVWHVGAVDPDLWAAIAPCAGWRSFDTYGGRPDGALADLWRAADGGSDVESLLDNLSQLPAYVYHGGADETVPVEEARAMAAHYDELGTEHVLHVVDGAGHWFDGEHPGADCVAHPDLLAFLQRHEREEEPRSLRFTCVHPALDSFHEWLRVDQLVDYGKPGRIEATWSPEEDLVTVRTENVHQFTVMRPASEAEVYLVNDDAVLAAPGAQPAKTIGQDALGMFVVQVGEDRISKRFDRSGPIKQGWTRTFIAVLPTGGTREENAAALARQQYDASVWAYRGNGVFRSMTDVEFLESLENSRANLFTNVVIYGNASTNKAYARVVPRGPLRVERGRVRVGNQVHEGDDLVALFVKRRQDSEAGQVLVNGSTGARGDRLAPVINHFVSGAGFPDYVVASSDVLTQGDGGVLAAGWLNHRWQLP